MITEHGYRWPIPRKHSPLGKNVFFRVGFLCDWGQVYVEGELFCPAGPASALSHTLLHVVHGDFWVISRHQRFPRDSSDDSHIVRLVACLVQSTLPSGLCRPTGWPALSLCGSQHLFARRLTN